MKREIDPTHRTFVSYIDRTREFYAAQGYERPYAWSHYEGAPFTKLRKPLSESQLALVTTASPLRPSEADVRVPKSVWSGPVTEPPERLYTDDLAWDKESTHTDDVESFLPIRSLEALASEGRIGGLAARFHGVPTEYSQRRTIERDAPEILKRLREDDADIALLVPL